MPLHITCEEQLQNNIGKEVPPLILDAPKLQMLYYTEEQILKDGVYGEFLQDIFELSNIQTTEEPYVLLPSGCSIMLFLLRYHTSACYLCGPLTEAKKIIIPPGSTLLCVRIRTGRLKWFKNRLASGLANRVIPLYKCFADSDVLLDQLNFVATFEKRCDIIFEYLRKKGAANYSVDPVIQRTIDLIDESRGRCWVHELAETVSRSERFLSRIFREMTGLSMKAYCEIVKFQSSFYLILITQPRNLSQGVKEYGYYDLPHMNRAYRKFINYTVSDVRFLNIDEVYVPELLSEDLK